MAGPSALSDDFDPRARIGSDRKASRLLQEASQLKSHGAEVVRFFLNAVRCLGGTSPALLSYVETLVSVVRATDQFPADAICELERGGLALRIDSRGFPLPADEARGAAPVASPPSSGFILDGLESVSPLRISEFMAAYAAKRLSRSAFEGFLGASDRLRELWDVDRLRAFYAAFGSPKWLSPMEDLARLDRLLEGEPGSAKTRAVVLRAMADAGRMGFCPAQYLRRVIAPRLERDVGNPEAFEKKALLLSAGFRYVCAEMGSAGDGSASNLFTLKTLIRPLAAPGSRLFVEAYYDEPGTPGPETIVYTIARGWARLFREGGPRARDLLRGYADVLFEGIARIETPRALLAYSERLFRHLSRVLSLVAAASDYAAFNKAAHARGTAVLLARAERSSSPVLLLTTLLAHIDAVEGFLPEPGAKKARPFGREYQRYLRAWANGAFRRPEDVQVYADSCMELAGSAMRDSDELLEAIMAYARDPEERAKLLGFARDCDVFDKAIYLSWRERPEAERRRIVEFLNEASRRYLVEGDYKPSRIPAGFEAFDIELAIVKRHAVASDLTKKQVDEILKAHARDPLPAMPEAFLRPFGASIAERGYETDSAAALNLDRDFVGSRARLAQEAAEASAEPGARSAEGRRLEASARARLAELEAMEREAEAAGEAKRAAGLREQASGLAAFAACLETLGAAAGDEGTVPDEALEGGLYFLAGDKAFAKSERDALVRYALGRLLEGRPDRLSEEPFSSAISVDPEAQGFGFDEVSALRELWTVGVSTAAGEYFQGPFKRLAPASAAALRRLYFQREPTLAALGAESAAEALADQASRRLVACAQGPRFEKELAAIEKAGSKPRREILFVAAKRRLEHFFGYVGELCIKHRTGEILRPDFIPVRIVDLGESRLVGYVHVLLVKASGSGAKALLVAGVEPKSSWMLHFDEGEFYARAKDYLAEAAARAGASLVLMTCSQVARSNCASLAARIARDIAGKRQVGEGRTLLFPEGAWNMLPAVPLWSSAAASKATRAAAGSGGA